MFVLMELSTIVVSEVLKVFLQLGLEFVVFDRF